MMKVMLLQTYRLAVLVAICWLIREQHVRVRVQGDRPIALEEVDLFFPEAARLKPDHSNRAGLFVLDLDGGQLGYVIRTSPWSDHIKGYAGPTDVMVAFDLDLKVLGYTVHHSEDTRSHVKDVVTDRKYKKLWQGMPWDEVAAMNLKEAGVEGVSGSTMTSMAMAESVVHRLRSTSLEPATPATWKVTLRDVGLAMTVVIAAVLAFSRRPGRSRLRRFFQVFVIGYVGLLNGDLLAQSLLAGWSKSGFPWQTVPGLVLLATAAFLVPWATRKPLYCQQICPHGIAQEWAGRLLPQRWRASLPPDIARGLRWLPGLSLAVILFIVMMAAPIDLAELEPFDAYLLTSAGWATIAIAIGGLVAALFVPMAYCRYGCPTGALLEFVRSHGANDRFGKRDLAAALMVGLAALLYWKFEAWHPLLLG